MLEQLLIFTRGGLILWTCRELGNALKGSPIDTLIRSCLLEERSGAASYNYDAPGAAYTLKWTFHNELGLVFVAVYQRILHLLYVDELLEMVKREFSKVYEPKRTVYNDFDDVFQQLKKEAEDLAEKMKKTKQPAKIVNANLSKKQGIAQKGGVDGGNKKKSGDDGNGDKDGNISRNYALENGHSNVDHVVNGDVTVVGSANDKENRSSNTGAFDKDKLKKLRGGKGVRPRRRGKISATTRHSFSTTTSLFPLIPNLRFRISPHVKTKTLIIFRFHTQTRFLVNGFLLLLLHLYASSASEQSMATLCLAQPYFSKQKHSSFTYGVQHTGLRRASFPVKNEMSLRTSMGLESAAVESSKGAAILWYKHDLRIDDHPGLVAASHHGTLMPLYIFDHRIITRFSDEMLELLLFALEDLRKSLKDQGSNLMIRFGNAEIVIEKLVKEVKATSIYAEEEVEYQLCRMLDAVQKTLTSTAVSSAEVCPRMVVWSTPFYGTKNLEDLPVSYDDLKKMKWPVVSAVLPTKLPGPEMDLTWGELPTLEDLKKLVGNNVGTSKNKWMSVMTKSELQQDQVVTQCFMIGDVRRAASEGRNKEIESSKITRRKRPERSVFLTQERNLVGGGTNNVLNALAAYLRYLEGTAQDEWQEVHEKLREAESREGASFGALFGSALLFGIISRRRVYYEAIKYEKERNGGFLSPFGYSAVTVAAAVNTVCSMEWYWLLALRSQVIKGGIYSVRIWRWNGYLIHYTVSGHKGPGVLLVHGFGAFLEHYRDNISHIAEGGNRVWAITLLGFGKSEKPNIVYTEVMWAKLIRDFVIEVVEEPVHLVGNSIGGYFVAIVAGLWPALAKSVVLINSAGNVVPEYSAVHLSEDRQTSGAAWLGARLLLLYLRLNIRNLLKNFYPSKMERADDWLINEMLRASYDPGVLVVLECIFSFDLSVPLNYLLEGLESKVLVIQGMRDPLFDSRSKLAVLREHCKGIVTRELDAGHCPHDELPAAVNSILQEWVVNVEREDVSVGLIR